MTQTQEQGFWSRRMAGVKAEAEAEKRAVEEETARLEAETEAAREAELAEKTDAEILQDLGLPDPDALKPGDDFSAFMAKAVPERLRRRALRRLWTSNPVLANLDGLTDYSEDFTDAATVVPELRTAYEVGRGMFEHVRKLASEAEEAEKPAEVAMVEEIGQEETPPAGLRAEAEPDMDVPVEDMAEAEYDPAPATAPAPRRHMRVSFATEEDRR